MPIRLECCFLGIVDIGRPLLIIISSASRSWRQFRSCALSLDPGERWLDCVHVGVVSNDVHCGFQTGVLGTCFALEVGRWSRIGLEASSIGWRLHVWPPATGKH
jgi:hypothetical protein